MYDKGMREDSFMPSHRYCAATKYEALSWGKRRPRELVQGEMLASEDHLEIRSWSGQGLPSLSAQER